MNSVQKLCRSAGPADAVSEMSTPHDRNRCLRSTRKVDAGLKGCHRAQAGAILFVLELCKLCLLIKRKKRERPTLPKVYTLLDVFEAGSSNRQDRSRDLFLCVSIKPLRNMFKLEELRFFAKLDVRRCDDCNR
ncbi:unnamed protein product [Effrenium voratum]|nr:unnamed protein product [Effrenium voratum]